MSRCVFVSERVMCVQAHAQRTRTTNPVYIDTYKQGHNFDWFYDGG